MAEEIENTQKPKAELIKHTQADHLSVKSPGETIESSERRKVIVVKKKPSTQPGGADHGGQSQAAASPGARKKVVIASHPKDEAADTAEKPHLSETQAKTSETTSQADEAPVKTHDAPPSAGGNRGAQGSASSQFSFMQRPAVAVGRVGGK